MFPLPDRDKLLKPGFPCLLVLVVTACASREPLPVPVPKLAALLSGNTMFMPGPTAESPQTVVYLDPAGGGWADRFLAPATYPRPNDLQRVLRWYISGDSALCLWLTPLIGQMPSNAPVQRKCLRMVSAPTVPSSLGVQDAGPFTTRTYPVMLVRGDWFPANRIAQYEHQVRVLYGGLLPVWPIP